MKLGFIGGGQMCEAIIKGLYDRKEVPAVRVSEPSEARREFLATRYPGVTTTSSNGDILSSCDIVILAVKPQYLGEALARVHNSHNALIVSICAGVPISRLEDLVGSSARIVRVMPNLPAMVGEGATGFCLNAKCQQSDGDSVKSIFGAVGAVVEQVPESIMDVVTAVSGSGPAYMCILIEALADAAVQHGMPRETALRLAAQTCVGGGKLVLQGEHPAVIKDKICSPGGTSIAAVAVLEEKGFRAAAMAAVSAVVARSKELGKL